MYVYTYTKGVEAKRGMIFKLFFSLMNSIFKIML